MCIRESLFDSCEIHQDTADRFLRPHRRQFQETGLDCNLQHEHDEKLVEYDQFLILWCGCRAKHEYQVR